MDGQESIQIQENKQGKFTFLIVTNIVLLLAFFASTFFLWNSFKLENSSNVSAEDGSVQGASTKDPEYLDKIAESLKTAGFVIYGESQDKATEKQLGLFGKASSKLDFVECNPQAIHSNADECVAKGIDEYPTWVSGENKFVGVRSISELEKMLAVTVL